jgi:hypothetical protein
MGHLHCSVQQGSPPCWIHSQHPFSERNDGMKNGGQARNVTDVYYCYPIVCLNYFYWELKKTPAVSWQCFSVDVLAWIPPCPRRHTFSSSQLKCFISRRLFGEVSKLIYFHQELTKYEALLFFNGESFSLTARTSSAVQPNWLAPK